jgi:tetratricopeptide (TPR) repeat protein
MKRSALPALFLAWVIFAPPLLAQQRATPAPAPGTAAARAAAQRESDEILARTYMATKRYREAADMYESLAKAHPRDPSYLNFTGIAYMQNGELRRARSWFERCVKLEPRYAEAYNNLGATWYTEKDFKRALEYYQRAVALQPGVASYHTNVGYAYFSLKMLPEAEQAFKRALLMDPFIFQQNERTGSVLQDRSVADRGLFAFTMARSYASTGDAMRCANYLRRALDEGYLDIATAHTDPTFAPVLEDPEMQAVLALIPTTRNEAAGPASR